MFVDASCWRKGITLGGTTVALSDSENSGESAATVQTVSVVTSLTLEGTGVGIRTMSIRRASANGFVRLITEVEIIRLLLYYDERKCTRRALVASIRDVIRATRVLSRTSSVCVSSLVWLSSTVPEAATATQ